MLTEKNDSGYEVATFEFRLSGQDRRERSKVVGAELHAMRRKGDLGPNIALEVFHDTIVLRVTATVDTEWPASIRDEAIRC